MQLPESTPAMTSPAVQAIQRDYEQLRQLKQELDRRTAWLLGAYLWLLPSDRQRQLASLPTILLQELYELTERDYATLSNKDRFNPGDQELLGRLLNCQQDIKDLLKESLRD